MFTYCRFRKPNLHFLRVRYFKWIYDIAAYSFLRQEKFISIMRWRSQYHFMSRWGREILICFRMCLYGKRWIQNCMILYFEFVRDAWEWTNSSTVNPKNFRVNKWTKSVRFPSRPLSSWARMKREWDCTRVGSYVSLISCS